MGSPDAHPHGVESQHLAPKEESQQLPKRKLLAAHIALSFNCYICEKVELLPQDENHNCTKGYNA